MKQIYHQYKLGGFFLLFFFFVLYVGYIWQKNQSNIENHYFVVKQLSKLQINHQDLSIQLLETFHIMNNDQLNHTILDSQRILTNLLQDHNKDEHSRHFDQLRINYSTQNKAIQSFKSYVGIVKNSIAYLHLSLNDKKLIRSLPPELIIQAQNVLFSFYSGEELPSFYPATGELQETPLYKHLQILYEYYPKMRLVIHNNKKLHINEDLASINKSISDEIEMFNQQDERLRFFFILSSVLFILVGFFTYIKERKGHFLSLRLAQDNEHFIEALNETSIVSKTDLNGIITFVNDKFCDISAYKREQLIGQSHNIVRSPHMPSRVFKDLWNVIQSKKIYKGIITNQNRFGDEYIVETVILPITDLSNNIVEYLAIRHDITELVRSREEAKAAEKSKDEFLSNMSHELRTPLNGILGFTKILLKTPRPDEDQRYLQTINDSATLLLTLINDILDVSKIQSGKFLINPHSFHLKQSLISFMPRFDAQIQQAEVSLVSTIESHTDTYLVGDWLRISQIITNLISNAIKFTPPLGTVTLDVSYLDDELCIKVSDTGIGMSLETQNRIFKPFEQADGSTTRKYGGTGLGLSITSKLIEMMYGRLELKSQEAKGSTFTVHIPLRISLETPQLIDEPVIVENRALKGHILVAEDNKTNQMLVKIILEEFGLSCDIAQDGLEALQMYKHKQYDLVLMDENMPQMNGLESMLEIRSIYGKDTVPIVALTANVMEGDKQRFLEAGMDDFIGKPLSEEKLYAILKRFLPYLED